MENLQSNQLISLYDRLLQPYSFSDVGFNFILFQQKAILKAPDVTAALEYVL